MKRIFHPGGSVLTGSELADAVLLYAAALSGRSQFDLVDIPIIGDDGTHGRAQFQIGSVGQLVSVTALAAPIELIEPATTEMLHRMAADEYARVPSGLADDPQFAQLDEFDY